MRLLLVLAFLFSFEWAAAQVLVRAQGTTASDIIRLSDIADLRALSPRVQEQLAQLEIYSGLKPGQRINIPASELSQILRKSMTQMGLAVEDRPLYRFPQSLMVRRAVPLTDMSFTELLRLELEQSCDECQVSISEVKIPKTLMNCELWSITSQRLKMKPQQLVEIETECPQKQIINISAKASIFKKGVMTQRSLTQHSELGLEDLKEAWVDVSYSGDEPLSLQAALGRKVKRRLAENSPIFRKDLEKDFDVKRGQAAKIILGSGGLEITSMGIAEENGVVGDLIKVKNLSTQKVLAGRVDTQGNVRIE